MKGSFVFYKGKIRSLPKGIFLLIILLMVILIPVIVTAIILFATSTFIIKKISGIFLPKKKEKIEYTEYEIVEEKEEKKFIP